MNVPGILLLLLALSSGLALVFLKPFSRAIAIGGVLILTALMVTAYLANHEWRYARNSSNISIGTKRTVIEKKLGRPAYITNCRYSPVYNETIKPIENCHVEIWYKSFFFPGVGRFSFDHRQRLIAKEHWISY